MQGIGIGRREKWLLLLFFCGLSCIVIAPLASNSEVPDVLDYISHLALIVQAKLGMQAGQFPLRIAPLEQHGWGYPLYQFYSPSSYTMAGLIYAFIFSGNIVLAYKATIWVALLVGSIYTFRLALWWISDIYAALLASVVYLTSPYYLIVINHIGGFNEAIAMGLIPVALYYSLRSYYEQKIENFLLLSLSWYFLATVHIITFGFSSIFCAGLLILIALQDLSRLKNLLGVFVAYLFGCLLAMWYLAPVEIYSSALEVSQFLNNLSAVYDYRLSLANLLSFAANFSINMAPTDDISNVIAQTHPSLGMPIILAVIICTYAVLNKLTLQKSIDKSWLFALLGTFYLIFFGIWSPVNFWILLPKAFSIIQYCWRLLSVASLVGALLFAWAYYWLFKENSNKQTMIITLFTIIIANNFWFAITEVKLIATEGLVENHHLIFNQGTYLVDYKKNPRWIAYIGDDGANIANTKGISKIGTGIHFSEFVLKDLELVSMPNKIAALLSVVTNDAKNFISKYQTGIRLIDVAEVESRCKQHSGSVRCLLKDIHRPSILELPVLYYPHLLKITVNGQVTPYQGVLSDGRVMASVVIEPQKMNDIKINFIGLMWANWVSRIAWLLWVTCWIYVVKRNMFANSKDALCH